MTLRWVHTGSAASWALLLLACGPRETAHTPPLGLTDGGLDAAPTASAAAVPAADAAPAEPPAPVLRKMRVQALRPNRGEYDITLDVTDQVLELDLPAHRTFERAAVGKETPPEASFATAATDQPFVSAAALALKAKQVDDGLVAAVELAAAAGEGAFPSRTALVETLLAKLAAAAASASAGDPELEAAAVVAAAARLGGYRGQLPPNVAGRAGQLRKRFLAEPLESKPLAFYTWSAELTRVFRRDRMLQSKLAPEVGAVLAQALAADDASIVAYDAWLRLNERLTNPLGRPDLRAAARAARAGQTLALSSEARFAPASRSHETDLGLRLYGARPIPPAFDLSEEMVERIRAGTLKLEPSATSGWYDHQAYALEPLVILERMPEGAKLEPTRSYQRHLEGLFRSLLSLTRETHIKQVPRVRMGAMMPRPNLILKVQPAVTVEPLPSYYLRRAASYRFVRGVLEQAFGAEALGRIRRLGPGGPLQLTLAQELAQIEQLFFGAYLTACEQIGLRCPADGTPDGSAAAARAGFESWAKDLSSDPDVGADMRMMVPVFYDVGQRKLKVWVVLGVARRPIDIEYLERPEVVAVADSAGNPVPLDQVSFSYHQEGHSLAYLVTAEAYVSRLLDRRQFRRLCDRYKTPSAILKQLR